MIQSVEDLDVFKKSHKITVELYKLTKEFPVDEKYNLVSQIRRASSSICANLMEGSHRNNTKEFRQFVGISNGSVGELKYHILLSKDLGYLKYNDYEFLIKELNIISKMLRGLIKSLSNLSTSNNSNTSTNTDTITNTKTERGRK